ncbi:MAG: CtsR family transcriptional regulator [Bacillota bacterium]|jgi:transcriptional regulator CtsR
MGSLSDYIESYLKLLLDNGPHDCVEVQRRELAERFRCAPSQINYVLSTRFTVERGYVVETRRGGGGYIRIYRLDEEPETSGIHMVYESVGDAIDRKAAEDLIARLVDMGVLDERDAACVRAAVFDQEDTEAPELERIIRARVLRAILMLMLTQPPTA